MINDEWFQQGGFETYKHPTPIKYETATDNGTIDTLEGPVNYTVGHKIITGPKGERYPVSPIKFSAYYDDNGDGTATPKKIMKVARLADHDGVVRASWGNLESHCEHCGSLSKALIDPMRSCASITFDI